MCSLVACDLAVHHLREDALWVLLRAELKVLGPAAPLHSTEISLETHSRTREEGEEHDRCRGVMNRLDTLLTVLKTHTLT